ncbi:MAG: acid--CoA ligase, partial [Rhodospirillaceae bacterium]|nr:acid--CoA ligase [Rhodospirillaceae bacterium]
MTIPANDWIAHHARFTPEQEAMHDLASGRHFTYQEMHDRVEQAALYLRDGLGVGD